MHNTTGSNWIRRSTRLAIYHRDGFCCVYCSRKLRVGRDCTLDHVVAGKGSDPKLLVTACRRCNEAKGNMSLAGFAAYRASLAMPIDVSKVRAAQRKPIDRAMGRKLAAAEMAA